MTILSSGQSFTVVLEKEKREKKYKGKLKLRGMIAAKACFASSYIFHMISCRLPKLRHPDQQWRQGLWSRWDTPPCYCAFLNVN